MKTKTNLQRNLLFLTTS